MNVDYIIKIASCGIYKFTTHIAQSTKRELNAENAVYVLPER